MNSAIRYVDQVLNEGTNHDFNIGMKVLTVHGWRTGKIMKMTKGGITVKWSNGEVSDDLSPNLLVPLQHAKTFREATRKKVSSTAKSDYIEYLNDTLIPDLKDSGSAETAKDFEYIVEIIKTGKLPETATEYWDSLEEFIGYLEKTLIPDLKESGRTATAEDFEEGMKYITPLVKETEKDKK